MIPKVRYRIASFNIKQFSNESASHGDVEAKKDLNTIAKIITDNSIDIIAIQEIQGKNAFRELMAAIACGYSKDITADILEKTCVDGKQQLRSVLGGNDYLACSAGDWQGRWTKPNSKWGTAISEEGYAFIWNTRRIGLPINGRGEVQPVIKHKKEIKFVRPPFYGRFITRDINVAFEIRLLNVHVLYTKNAKLKKLKDSDIDVSLLNSSCKEERMNVMRQMREANLSPLEISQLQKFNVLDDIARRKYEVKNLITEVLSREEDDLGWGRYCIMLGDYNLNLINSCANYKDKRAVIEEIIPYGKNRNEKKKYIVKQEQLTSLSRPAKREKDPEDLYNKKTGEDRYVNNYDHFTYNINMTDSGGRDIYIGEPVRINVDKYGLTNREYYERVSDHLPIMMEIGF